MGFILGGFIGFVRVLSAAPNIKLHQKCQELSFSLDVFCPTQCEVPGTDFYGCYLFLVDSYKTDYYLIPVQQVFIPFRNVFIPVHPFISSEIIKVPDTFTFLK